MAGAEGERRLDLDTQAVMRDAMAIVAPMHEESARLDRPQAGQARAHPIAVGQRFERQRAGGGVAGGAGDELANCVSVGDDAERNLDRPIVLRAFEDADRRLIRIEQLRQKICDPLRHGCICAEPGNHGRSVDLRLPSSPGQRQRGSFH